MEKFEATGYITYQTTPVHQRRKHSNENIAAIRKSVDENPRISIFKQSQELGLSFTTTWRIFYMNLHFHSYKIVLTQELKPNVHRLHYVFSDWAMEQLEVDPDSNQKIIYSNEAHFWMNGFVNKQNCCFCCNENQMEIHERRLYFQ